MDPFDVIAQRGTSIQTGKPRPNMTRQTSTLSANMHEENKEDFLKKQLVAMLKTKQIDHSQFYGAEYSLNFLHYLNPVRWRILNTVQEKWFEGFIITIILLNCLALAMYDVDCDPCDDSEWNDVLDKIEFFFLAIFTVEMFMKIIAFGFIASPGTYLRSNWNQLDCFIVLTGYVDVFLTLYASSSVELKPLRALRVLRSLRVINGMPSLQRVMNSILSAIPRLGHVAILTLGIIVVYGIVGVMYFGGKLDTACYYTAPLPERVLVSEGPCAQDGDHGYHCPAPFQTCLDAPLEDRIGFGIISFDNIGVSMLTVFTCITLEGWTDVWYACNDAVGSELPWLYFVSLILIGAFFVINLVLGVISGEFTKEGKRMIRQRLWRKKHKKVTFKSSVDNYTDWINTAENQNAMHKIYVRGRAANPFADLGQRRQDVDTKDEKAKAAKEKKPKIRPQDIAFAHPRAAKFARSPPFVLFIMLVVLLNTIFLAMDHAFQSQAYNDLLRIGNFVFVGLFVAELLFKLWALGPQQYWLFKFNRFDAFVVFISVVELVAVEAFDANPLGLSVFRSVRLLRLFKYTQWWEPLAHLINRLIDELSSIMSLLALLQLLILIFALLGMQLFGGKDIFADYRSNFNNFWNAYVTVFQILSGENWNEIMYYGIESYGGIDSAGGLIALYFVILVVVGNYMVLNIFLAIAVDCLDALNDAIKEVNEQRARNKEDKKQMDSFTAHVSFKKLQGNEEIPEVDKSVPDHNAFYIFSPTNPFRVALNNLIFTRWFDPFILICIIISSCMLAAEDVENTDAVINGRLEVADFIFSGIFCVEMLIKWVALGLVLHPRAYMRDGWNLLDMVVVLSSLAAITLSTLDVSGAVGVVKVLRVIRVLRPLRSINRLPKLKQVVQCLIVSVKNILVIFALTFMFTFLFAIIAVQLFKGAFYRCNSDEYLPRAECIGFFNTTDGLTGEDIVVPQEFINVYMNYDNIARGMQTLFASSTTEGWMDTVFNSVDATGEGTAMIENYDPGVALFYIMYMIVVGFFLVNLFIGFVIVTFRDTIEEEFEECEFDKGDRECIVYVLEAKPKRIYHPPESAKLRTRIFDLVTSWHFDLFIMIMIFANTITLMCEYSSMSQSYEDVLKIFNVIFTSIFVLESLLKQVAFGIKGYFVDPWNQFDFIVAYGSVIDIALEGSAVNLTFLRLIRVLRVVKMLKKGGLKRLLYTFIKSLKALPYVSLLICILFYIYAIIGMQIFGRVQQHDDLPINRHTNFSTLWQSLALLFRCATGENWQAIMEGMTLQPGNGDEYGLEPLCDKNPPDDEESTCGSWFAVPYMISFVIFNSFLVLNLFVAVICDNFDYLIKDDSTLGEHRLEEFIQAWSEFDREATGWIHHEQLEELLRAMEPPLGLGAKCPKSHMVRVLSKLDCPMRSDGFVAFKPVMFALIKYRRANHDWSKKTNEQIADLVTKWIQEARPADIMETFPPIVRQDGRVNAFWSMRFYFSVLHLQQKFRFYYRKRMAEKAVMESQARTQAINREKLGGRKLV